VAAGPVSGQWSEWFCEQPQPELDHILTVSSSPTGTVMDHALLQGDYAYGNHGFEVRIPYAPQ